MKRNDDINLCSVLMITYNHEKYIAQAIDSVLMQKTNFDYEIVIGEDCSTDRTREIVLEYKAKHPGKIRLLLQEKNVGMMQNFIDTLKACTGKYIALLEGDDYWTDPYKLQKQVDILEAHPEYSLCFTDRRIIDLSGNVILIDRYNKKVYNTIDVITYRFCAPTQTVLFRNFYNIQTFLKRHNDFIYGDVLLTLFLSLLGDMYHLPDITANYRQTHTGVWTSKVVDKTHEEYLGFLNRVTSIVGLKENNFLVAFLCANAFAHFLYINKRQPFKIIKNIKKYYNYFLKPFSLLELILAFRDVINEFKLRRKTKSSNFNKK